MVHRLPATTIVRSANVCIDHTSDSLPTANPTKFGEDTSIGGDDMLPKRNSNNASWWQILHLVPRFTPGHTSETFVCVTVQNFVMMRPVALTAEFTIS